MVDKILVYKVTKIKLAEPDYNQKNRNEEEEKYIYRYNI